MHKTELYKKKRIKVLELSTRKVVDMIRKDKSIVAVNEFFPPFIDTHHLEKDGELHAIITPTHYQRLRKLKHTSVITDNRCEMHFV